MKKLDDIILEINELSNKSIIMITNKDINIFNRANHDFIIKEKYLIKDDWKMINRSLTSRYYNNFNQYFSSYILPNDRLLLHSFSSGDCLIRRCKKSPPREIFNSKCVFIDLKNFKEISSTETFESEIRYMFLDNTIVIRDFSYNYFIYDINSLTKIKQSSNYCGYLFKFNNQNLITFSQYDENKTLITIYKIENNDLIESCKIKTNLSYEILSYIISLHKMDDNKFIIIGYGYIYIFQLNFD